MGTEQVPPQFGSVERSLREDPAQSHRHMAGTGAQRWIRGLAVASLAAGAALVARGNRKPGLIATAAGVMILLLDHPDDVGAVWNSIPRLIHTSRRLLDRTEEIVQDLTDQAETVRSFLDKATAQRS